MRYHSLDALRAAMMFLGVVLHSATAYAYPEGIWWYKDAQLSHAMDLLVLFLHTFRLPVFFTMAGFFSALLIAKRGPQAFLENRVHRILLPLLAGIVLIYPILRVQSDILYHRTPTLARIVKYVEPTHFWFLEVLFLTCLLAIACRSLLDKLPFPANPYPYMAVTFLALLPTEHGILDTPHSFVPVWTVQFAYAIFFAAGWAMHNGRHHLSQLIPHANRNIALGVLFATGSSALLIYKLLTKNDYRVLIAACGALSVWYLIFGLTGFFLQHFSTENRTIRYLADSAYWVYLTHPVALLVAQSLCQPLNWPAEAKFAAGILFAVPVLLIIYDLAVRNTFIGQFLNGHRWPSRLWAEDRNQQLANSAR